VSPFYKNLFEEQIRHGSIVNVYVAVAKGFDFTSINLGEYTKISLNHNRYDRYFFHIKHFKILKDIVRQYDIREFDILHAHSLFSNGYIAYKLYKRYGIPYIVAVRNTDVNVFFKYMLHLRKLGIKVLHNAKLVVFLSSKYREHTIVSYVPSNLQKEISDKSVILPNGVDRFWLNNKFNGSRNIKKNEIKIIYAGLISRNKNISTTVKACEILRSAGYNVKFTIVGRAEDKKEFRLIKLHDFINYIDQQPKENLLNLYRLNDIFVMPSIAETFGLVYVEAMSQGLPLIYTKGQGFDGYFEDGTVGYSVNCMNAWEISKRIIDIIENYKSISKNCLIFCNNFDWNIIAGKYKDIYEE
jgi:glycosyltransferase involved in cell wall biosynthesis